MTGIPLLAARTDFSLGESSLQVKKLVSSAKEQGYSAVCVVDTMTLGAMPALFDAAEKANIKAIIGVTIRVVDNPTERTKSAEQGLFQIKAYPQNENGLRSLFALLSKGLSKENFYYHSRVSLADVLELQDVVISTGDIHSVWHRDDASSVVRQLAERFPTYVEIAALSTPLFDRLNALAAATATDQVLPKLLTRPVMYAEPEDADSTDVMRAISTNGNMDNIFLARPYARDMAVLTQMSMLTKMSAAYRRATDRSLTRFDLQVMETFVEQCAYSFKKMAPCLPKMAPDEFQALMGKVLDGWGQRFATKVWGHRPEDLSPYKERLGFELSVIRKMGFSGYFLLVQEIVEFAKREGILVGPGRGSVGGSLIAYLMGITDIDPIRFGLLFERFINPDRIDLPDADLDFMSARRHEIVEYLTKKYGEAHVCGIVNFSTLGAASALRDSARVHGLQPYEYSCSKQMEKEHGVSLSLTESADAVPDIDKVRQERPVIWNHALRLEGVNRTLSQHAAGVVVAGEPIINRGVVSMQPGHPVVQWDKSRVEDFGLIKIDVLGLSTLDVIAQVLKYIEERHKKKINVLSLPLDDERVLKAFGAGDTTGIFQFEGGGMKKLLKELAMGGLLTFDDICAATALFRPGPLDAGLCDRYVQVKQGTAMPHYEHPALEECLSETLGVIVYQEQVMKITRVLCGFTPGESDGVRKAIGKKDMVKMKTFADQFVAGAELGTAQVELEDGRVVQIHRARKLKVKENGELWTIEQIMEHGYSLAESV
jgi:DNA polymerase-3 subunit alpha